MKYKIDDTEFYTRNLPVNARELVSWANVYLLAQVLIVMSAIQLTAGQPIQFLVVGITAVWLISVVNKF